MALLSGRPVSRMRYELFLRSAAPVADEVEAQVRADCPDLEVSSFEAEGQVMGVDLGADVEDPAAARLLVKAAFSSATRHGFQVYDPQLGRPVTEADRELITTQVERTAAFMQSMPVSTAGMAPDESEGMSPTTRLWVIIGAAVLGAMVVSQGLTCLFSGS